MRDNQRERVYRAEWELQRVLDRQLEFPTISVAGSTLTVPMEKKFACLMSMQRYVTRIAPGVTVRERQGQTKAVYQAGTIAIPMIRRWAMRELVLLHEIAHHFTAGEHHGPAFVSKLTDLLSTHVGPEAGFMYRVFINDNGGKG